MASRGSRIISHPFRNQHFGSLDWWSSSLWFTPPPTLGVLSHYLIFECAFSSNFAKELCRKTEADLRSSRVDSSDETSARTIGHHLKVYCQHLLYSCGRDSFSGWEVPLFWVLFSWEYCHLKCSIAPPLQQLVDFSSYCWESWGGRPLSLRRLSWKSIPLGLWRYGL